MEISLLEWLGYLSSVIVAISLTMSSIVKLRILNLFGSGLFSLYGFMIGALPVGYLNFFIFGINIYYLYKIYSRKEAFELLDSKPTDSYLQHFIQINTTEIKEFFPDFELINKNEPSYHTALLIRDNLVAGVFIAEINENKMNILLDFVSKTYRDLKPGYFLYQQNKAYFKELGIQSFEVKTQVPQHIQFLNKMNFVKTKENTYTLSIL